MTRGLASGPIADRAFNRQQDRAFDRPVHQAQQDRAFSRPVYQGQHMRERAFDRPVHQGQHRRDRALHQGQNSRDRALHQGHTVETGRSTYELNKLCLNFKLKLMSII